MEHEMMEHSEILLYSDENGKEFVNVVFMDETFWLTQVGMAELFRRAAGPAREIRQSGTRRAGEVRRERPVPENRNFRIFYEAHQFL